MTRTDNPTTPIKKNENKKEIPGFTCIYLFQLLF